MAGLPTEETDATERPAPRPEGHHVAAEQFGKRFPLLYIPLDKQ
jgi:hypothetical protein